MRIQDTYHFVLPSQFNPLPLMDSGQKVRLGVTKCGGGLEQVGPFPKLILRDHLVVSVIEQHLALLPTAQLLGDSGGKDSTVSGLASRIDDLMQAKCFGFPLALFRSSPYATGGRRVHSNNNESPGEAIKKRTFPSQGTIDRPLV